MASKLPLRLLIKVPKRTITFLHKNHHYSSMTTMHIQCLKLCSQNVRFTLPVSYFHQKVKPWNETHNLTRYNFSSNTTEDKEKKPSLYQRLKIMYKEYWYVLLPVHLATSAVWFGGFYYLAISGLDIVNLLEVLGAPESWIETMRHTKAGGIVTAYTMYKIATPARYTVTLGGTTISINYLKKYGWIKPIPNKDQLRIMYNERKLQMRDKTTEIANDINKAKDEIKEEFIKTQKEITDHVKEAKVGLAKSTKEAHEDFKAGVKETSDELKTIGKAVAQLFDEKTRRKKQNE